MIVVSFINQPDLYLDFLKPSGFLIDVAGGATEGGKNGLQEPISMDTWGGGYVICTLESCYVQAPQEHEYVNQLGARLNRSIRFINVPIKTDWMGPFPTLDRWPQPIISGIPHSDGSRFSDGAGYSQATIYGTVTEAAALNAGIIKLQLTGNSRPLRMSDWFAIPHPTKGWRAYRYWDVLNVSSDINPIYTIALEIPLREAVLAGTRVELARPKCVMKLKAGQTIPWRVKGFWRSEPTIELVEAF